MPPEMPLDEAALTRVLGEEMTRVLQTAREAAHAIVAKAELQAAEIVSEAESVALSWRSEAETAAQSATERAREDAAETVERTKIECRAMIEEAREARLKILADLAERRRTLLIQLEQVRVGKESMVAVVESVASSVSDSIESIRAQLQGAEESSRIVADRAATQLDAAFASGEDVEVLAEQTLAKIPVLAVPDGVVESAQRPDAPVSTRVFDIEREQGARSAVSKTSSSPENGKEPISIPSFLNEAEETGRSGGTRTAARTPDATPTISQGLRVSTDEERLVDQAVEQADESSHEDPAVLSGSVQPEHPVDQLFAKIRASRESTVADAQRVLSHEADVDPKPHTSSRRRPKEQPSADAVPGTSAPTRAGAPIATAPGETSVAADSAVVTTELEVTDEPRQLRDRALEPAHHDLSRSLKRVLREEQNLLLDALRNRKKGEALVSLLPGSEARDRLISAVDPGVSTAFEAGYEFLGGAPKEREGDLDTDGTVKATSGRLADEILDALVARLAPRFENGSTDEGEISEIVGSAFREWKAARVDALCLDYAISAFGAGEVAFARPQNMALIWNLDTTANGCPDCDDNGVAGKVAAGETFPTGHQHPPVHPGCRCFLSNS